MGRKTDASFGTHARELRKRRDLTQEQLAELAGLSADTVRRLEGEAFSPSLRTLRKLATGLDISLTTLFAGFEASEGESLAREILDALRVLTTAERLAGLRVLRSLTHCAELSAGESNPWPPPWPMPGEQGSADNGE